MAPRSHALQLAQKEKDVVILWQNDRRRTDLTTCWRWFPRPIHLERCFKIVQLQVTALNTASISSWIVCWWSRWMPKQKKSHINAVAVVSWPCENESFQTTGNKVLTSNMNVSTCSRTSSRVITPRRLKSNRRSSNANRCFPLPSSSASDALAMKEPLRSFSLMTYALSLSSLSRKRTRFVNVCMTVNSFFARRPTGVRL